MPRILVYDIETCPFIIKAFELRNEMPVSHNWILQERNILTAAWMWVGDKKARSVAVPAKSPTDDREIVQTLLELFEQADAIVAHYGDKFDHRFIMQRVIYHGYLPPPPVIQIDTWKIARSKFKFATNRLDYLGQYLGLGRKMQTGGWELWDRCMAGEAAALKKMREYNEQDVELLCKVYQRLQPFVPPRVNAALYIERPACPRCSGVVQFRGNRLSRTGLFKRYQCKSCGGWSSQPIKGGILR